MLGRVGRFEVEGPLARGGAGQVLRGRDPATGAPVAIKLLIEAADPGAPRRARFEREAEVLRRIQHPNVIGLREAGEVGGRPFVVLDYVDGETLEHDVGHAARGARLYEADDVRMVEAGEDARLDHEARLRLGVERAGGRQHLDRHTDVAAAPGVDDAHGAPSQLTLDDVDADALHGGSSMTRRPGAAGVSWRATVTASAGGSGRRARGTTRPPGSRCR